MKVILPGDEWVFLRDVEALPGADGLLHAGVDLARRHEGILVRGVDVIVRAIDVVNVPWEDELHRAVKRDHIVAVIGETDKQWKGNTKSQEVLSFRRT